MSTKVCLHWTHQLVQYLRCPLTIQQVIGTIPLPLTIFTFFVIGNGTDALTKQKKEMARSIPHSPIQRLLALAIKLRKISWLLPKESSRAHDRWLNLKYLHHQLLRKSSQISSGLIINVSEEIYFVIAIESCTVLDDAICIHQYLGFHLKRSNAKIYRGYSAFFVYDIHVHTST